MSILSPIELIIQLQKSVLSKLASTAILVQFKLWHVYHVLSLGGHEFLITEQCKNQEHVNESSLKNFKNQNISALVFHVK